MKGHSATYDQWASAPTDPGPRCAHCASTVNLIEGDGPKVVCRPCVTLFGGIARDPDSVDLGYLEELERLHGDVLRLITLSVGAHLWRWVKDGSWPLAEGRGGRP